MTVISTKTMPEQPTIYRKPEILGGAPVFRGTRATFQTLLDHIEDGGGKQGLEEFLEDFPTVSRELRAGIMSPASWALPFSVFVTHSLRCGLEEYRQLRWL